MEILRDIGLTEAEIKVYLALLELGSTSTGPIVDKSGVSSSKIYEILERLIQKGLASFVIQSGIKHFEAADPKRILDYVEEKESRLKLQKKKVQEILPELLLKKQLSKSSEAKIFRGIKGLKTVFSETLDLLKKGDTFLAMGIPSRTDTVNRFFVHWNIERAKREIEGKFLFDSRAKGELQTLTKNNPLAESKFLPLGDLQPAAINIAGDRVIIFPSESEKDPLLIVIDNKEIADSFRQQFNNYWNQKASVLSGIGAIQDLFEEMLEEGSVDFIGARGYFMDANLEWMNGWKERAIKKGFKLRNIVDPEVKGHYITKLPFAQTKYSLKKEFCELSVFWVMKNKVVISNWVDDEPIVTIIEDNRMVELYKKQFESLWTLD